MTIAELMIAMGIGSLAVLGMATAMKQMAVGNQTISQDTELSSLATDLKFFLRDQRNCTLNMQQEIPALSALPAPGTTFPIQSLGLLTNGAFNGKTLVQAGTMYPNPASGPIRLNPNGGAYPGMSLIVNGTMGNDIAGAAGTYSADLVINATKVGTAGSNFIGSATLTTRLPITLVIDYEPKIILCYANANALQGRYIQDEVCDLTASGGNPGAWFNTGASPHQFFNPATGQCTSNCTDGTQTTASCGAGYTLNGCNADTTGVNYVNSGVSATYTSGSLSLSIPTIPTVVIVSLANGGCSCAWETLANPPGLCQACCTPY